jgi:MFS family permease
MIKGYFSHYIGISFVVWERITLNFVVAITSSIGFFISFYLVKDLQFSILMAGYILSIYAVGMAIGGLLGGKLSDRWPAHTVSILFLILQATAFLILAYFKTHLLLVASLFLLGVTTSGFITSNNVCVLSQPIDKESARLKRINLLSMAGNLGMGVAAPLIGVFSHYGFNYIFFAASLILMVSALYLLFFTSHFPNTLNPHPTTEVAKQGLKIIFQDNAKLRILLLVLACIFLGSFIIAQLKSTYAIYLHDRFPAMGLHAASILFMVNSIMTVFFQVPFVNQFERYSRVMMVGVGVFLMGSGMLTLTFSHWFPIALVACVIYTAGEMLFNAMSQFVCYQIAPEHQKGQYLGLWRFVFSTSIIAGPSIGVVIYHHLGGNSIWYVCFGVGLVCLFACFYSKK